MWVIRGTLAASLRMITKKRLLVVPLPANAEEQMTSSADSRYSTSRQLSSGKTNLILGFRLKIRSIHFIKLLEDIIQIKNTFPQGHNKLNVYSVRASSILMQHLYLNLNSELLSLIKYK